MIVRLSWSEGAPDQIGDGFRLYKSVNGGSYTLKDTLPLNQTTYDDSDVAYGNYYRYKVVEYQGQQESTPAEIFVGLLQYSETSVPTDSLSRRPRRQPTEPVAVADGISKRPRRNLAESAGLSDAAYKAPARSLVETCAVGDWRDPFSLARTILQPVPAEAQETRAASRPLLDEVSVSSAPERGLARTLLDWEILDDGDRLVVSRELAEDLPVSSTYEWNSHLVRDAAAEVGVDADLSRSLATELDESLTASSEVERGIARLLEGWADVAHASSLVTGLARDLYQDVVVADDWERFTQLLRYASDAATPTDQLDGRTLARWVLHNVPATDGIKRLFARTLQDAAAISEAIRRGPRRVCTEALTLSYVYTRAPARIVRAKVQPWARLAVPGGSTPYPWDTGQGGFFLQRLAHSLFFRALARELLTGKTGRALELLELTRQLLSKKLKRGVTLSKPLR